MRTRKRILIVDDSKTMTAIISRILREVNYTDIDRAHDGGSALAALRRKQYDLVITDWLMEPISGIELTNQSGYALIESSNNPDYWRIGKEDEAWLDGPTATPNAQSGRRPLYGRSAGVRVMHSFGRKLAASEWAACT